MQETTRTIDPTRFLSRFLSRFHLSPILLHHHFVFFFALSTFFFLIGLGTYSLSAFLFFFAFASQSSLLDLSTGSSIHHWV
jgi:hypothetical protein